MTITVSNLSEKIGPILGFLVLLVAVRGVPVLLVSELVDSRWTFTVFARELRLAGASAVYPFALAYNG